MVQKTKPPLPYTKPPLARRVVVWPLTVVAILVFTALIFLLQVKILSISEPARTHTQSDAAITTPFPVSVNPKTKTITDSTAAESYITDQVASNHSNFKTAGGFIALIQAKLAQFSLYQHLATPVSRTLIVNSGERSEQITENFAGILGWTGAEQAEFIKRMSEETPTSTNGKIYPGKYTVDKETTPEEMARIIADRFNAEVRTRYTGDVEAVVPLRDALIIASLLEREAYDFEDMRYISGIIWNRLFIDMRLQIDATLQYVRGANKNEPWWPVPVPADKYLKSPFNTYQNAGLPPEPIANPSIDAIIAALNPRETDCLFYFHANDGTFYCSVTYEEHVAGLRKVFGTK
ncbi:endolytic transglycosylase MltG [Patescibacteria group bacterium]|nr:endolytic transglycosylase MltG [Patescibacteria group bacterium]